MKTVRRLGICAFSRVPWDGWMDALAIFNTASFFTAFVSARSI
jgi:hypothetical protein